MYPSSFLPPRFSPSFSSFISLHHVTNVVLQVGEIKVHVGTKAWMRENGIEISLQAEEQQQQSERRGETVVCAGFNHSFAGSISLLDMPKPEVFAYTSYSLTLPFYKYLSIVRQDQ